MKYKFLLTFSFFIICKIIYGSQSVLINFRSPIHSYLDQTPRDPFSKFVKKIEKGDIKLNFNSEKEYLLSLFEELNISPFSQLLVYSTTSLQLSRISPSNPRAIYFNDDIYLGYVPGGQVELIGIDPELGAIPYIFNLPIKDDLKHPSIYRSKRCMKCHASEETKGVPGLLLSSVIPGPGGGTIDAFRRGIFGHSVPYEERFGGWHISGDHPFSNSWANYTGIMQGGIIKKIPNPPGRFFSWNKYLTKQSDAIPHLILEHQVGFTNLCISITYRFREIKNQGRQENGSGELNKFFKNETDALLSYILFQHEAELPKNRLSLDSQFVEDFENNRKSTDQSKLLRKLNLKDRLFELRCSYMLFSNSFRGLPLEIKKHLFEKLRFILSCDEKSIPKEFSYFNNEERLKIHSILLKSLTGYTQKKGIH